MNCKNINRIIISSWDISRTTFSRKDPISSACWWLSKLKMPGHSTYQKLPKIQWSLQTKNNFKDKKQHNVHNYQWRHQMWWKKVPMFWIQYLGKCGFFVEVSLLERNFDVTGNWMTIFQMLHCIPCHLLPANRSGDSKPHEFHPVDRNCSKSRYSAASSSNVV